LELDADGLVSIAVPEPRQTAEPATFPVVRAPEALNPGVLDLRNFQRNTPADVQQMDFAVRRLQVEWDVSHQKGVGLRLQGLAPIDILFETAMPGPVTSDDFEDNDLYRDWLRRAEDPSDPFSEEIYQRPTVNDMAIFIFSSFQQQLLACLPTTVRTSRLFPDEEGLPYIRAFSEAALKVSQHLLRDSANRIRLAYTFTAKPQIKYLGQWQRDVQIKEKRHNYAKLYPSPPPFEYPWMKANFHRILAEREYMRALNPPALNLEEANEEEVLDPNDPMLYNRGGRSWGFWACVANESAPAARTNSGQPAENRKRRIVGRKAAPVAKRPVSSVSRYYG
ncbi:hypothetical protein NCC49_005295, partial [Naganishia albida]